MATARGQAADASPLTVALRIRPISDEEVDRGGTITAHAALDQTMVVLLDPSEDPDDILRQNRTREKQYMFDYVFDAIATQEEVYDKTTKDLINWVINGFNATVFAYGATGAGKTYTMLGSEDSPGIMARALNDLFQEMTKNVDQSYQVTMSYFELYNENIRDLLNPSSGLLDLREDNKGRNVVAGLSEVEAASTEDIVAMLLQGNKERTQEPTAANKTSSRSHAILQVTVRQQSRIRDTNQQVKIGRLFLIDLAGSERAAHTKNRGKRMVEGAHINRSLLALGNCINALVEKGPKAYVNYRDSKLTRILKDSLGGNSMTVMIAHISPASLHFEESRNTLLYADRAKNIKNTVKKNVIDVSYHIAQYQSIIGELREEIARLRKKIDEQDGEAALSSTVVGTAKGAVAGRTSGVVKKSGIAALKEQLVETFREQMDLRRKLMDTNSQSMELSLEQSRHLIIVRDWEGERHAKKKVNPLTEGKDNEATIDNKDLDNMEKGELETLALVGSPDEPPEVVMARERLGNLQVQRQRLDIEKNRLARELGECRAKAAQLEESLPSAIGSEEHREILSLLCKVHELEIENTESQSAILLKDFELRKKDMIIERYEHNRLLCDQIIQQQRRLVLDHAVDIPEDLEESFDLYLQLNEGEMNAGTPTELNPPRLHSVAQLMKIFGETEVDTSQRSDPSATESEQSSSTNDSPREAVSRRLPGRRRRRDADAIINGEEKLFRESAKARKIFSRKNHQDSAPDILEGAATRLDGVARVTARTPTPVKPETRRSRGTETRLVSLSDPCSPVGSPTGDPFKPKYQLPRDSSSPNPHFPGTKAEGAAGLRRYSRVGNKVGLHPRVEVEQTSPGEGVAELVSSRSPAPAANVKNQTQSISLIAAARRRAHNDGRLSISINDLTEIGVPSNRATQNVSSLSFVSSVATHDGVVRLDTGNGDPGHAAPRRDSLLVAPPRFQGISRNPTRNRVPSPEADDRSTIVADAGKAKAARGAPERRRRGVFRNSYDVEGDYSKPWRQNAALKNRAPGKGSKNGGGSKLWFPRDVPEREPQSLLSREAPSSTVPQVNSSSGVAPLTIVRKNRGGILANNATVHSTHSTPAGHVGAPPQQRKRSNPRGNAAINAPAGFTSGRKNAVSDDAVPRMAITGHALKNGDLF